jgi:hypothetical protein
VVFEKADRYWDRGETEAGHGENGLTTESLAMLEQLLRNLVQVLISDAPHISSHNAYALLYPRALFYWFIGEQGIAASPR